MSLSLYLSNSVMFFLFYLQEYTTMVNLAVALAHEGISAFRFDFAGNGESEGSFAYANYWREADDLRAVIQYFCGANRAISAILEHSKGVLKILIALRCGCLFGPRFQRVLTLCCICELAFFLFHSFLYADLKVYSYNYVFLIEATLLINVIVGGGVVLLFASKYHDIHNVVNLSGRYDMRGGIEERLGKDIMERIEQDGFVDVKNSTGSVEYRVTKESMMDRLNTNMHEACLQIDKECRVLTVHGSADTIIPVQDAHEFAKIIPNHKLHIVEGANHGYTKHQAELESVVLNFIKEGLKQN
ncbi:hypothetical protein Patl1_12176 [Pistacia atlantica]|uniref:Uncharacterized protein n=1 Tax=Pistacia atlantica TaxID=434234 RepID=A0ACC1A6N1_9ROSI|nr:hypothetical protein Patl1_12176 [Pistacia atlantica]